MSRVVMNGDVAFDIGANIGLHTVLLSQLVGQSGKVCVFEPNLELLPTLGRTVGGLGNATFFGCALSDKAAESDFSFQKMIQWQVSRIGLKA